MKPNTISVPEAIDKTDWNRIDAMRDTDIDFSDNPEWSTADFAIAKPQYAPKTAINRQVSINLSPEVIAFFQAMGANWQKQIDNVLREYITRNVG